MAAAAALANYAAQHDDLLANLLSAATPTQFGVLLAAVDMPGLRDDWARGSMKFVVSGDLTVAATQERVRRQLDECAAGREREVAAATAAAARQPPGRRPCLRNRSRRRDRPRADSPGQGARPVPPPPCCGWASPPACRRFSATTSTRKPPRS